MANLLGGTIFMLILYFSSLFGSIFILGPALPVLWLSPAVFRSYADLALGLWLALPTALLELVYGVKLVVTGDRVPRNESALIIMNHRCRLDWMFYWLFLHRYGNLAKEKIILKDDLKNIPGPGWAMQCGMFIFLRRRWESDQAYMDKVLSYFLEIKYPLQLLIFPEGTDFREDSMVKSNSFAAKQGKPPFKQCLHPRLKGFTYCVDKMRGRFEAIHDVTVGYPKNLCYGELDILLGNFPQEIHFDMTRYSMDQIPEDTEKLEDWCEDRWKEKEERLEKFYEKSKFEEKNPRDKILQKNDERVAKRNMVLVLLFWLVFLLVCAFMVYYYAYVRWYCMIVSTIYLVVSFFGGVDHLQLKVHNRRMPRVASNGPK